VPSSGCNKFILHLSDLKPDREMAAQVKTAKRRAARMEKQQLEERESSSYVD
jgi:hypothetical protein